MSKRCVTREQRDSSSVCECTRLCVPCNFNPDTCFINALAAQPDAAAAHMYTHTHTHMAVFRAADHHSKSHLQYVTDQIHLTES